MSMNYHKKEMLRQKDPITVKQVTSDNFIPTGATCGYVFALLSLVIATGCYQRQHDVVPSPNVSSGLLSNSGRQSSAAKQTRNQHDGE